MAYKSCWPSVLGIGYNARASAATHCQTFVETTTASPIAVGDFQFQVAEKCKQVEEAPTWDVCYATKGTHLTQILPLHPSQPFTVRNEKALGNGGG